MEPIRTPDLPDTMVGSEDSDVLPLPVRVEEGCTSSVWEFDELERQQIALGGRVGLVVLAHPTPPVALAVVAPYCERCARPMDWSAQLQAYVCSEGEDGQGEDDGVSSGQG